MFLIKSSLKNWGLFSVLAGANIVLDGEKGERLKSALTLVDLGEVREFFVEERKTLTRIPTEITDLDVFSQNERCEELLKVFLRTEDRRLTRTIVSRLMGGEEENLKEKGSGNKSEFLQLYNLLYRSLSNKRTFERLLNQRYEGGLELDLEKLAGSGETFYDLSSFFGVARIQALAIGSDRSAICREINKKDRHAISGEFKYLMWHEEIGWILEEGHRDDYPVRGIKKLYLLFVSEQGDQIPALEEGELDSVRVTMEDFRNRYLGTLEDVGIDKTEELPALDRKRNFEQMAMDPYMWWCFRRLEEKNKFNMTQEGDQQKIADTRSEVDALQRALLGYDLCDSKFCRKPDEKEIKNGLDELYQSTLDGDDLFIDPENITNAEKGVLVREFCGVFGNDFGVQLMKDGRGIRINRFKRRSANSPNILLKDFENPGPEILFSALAKIRKEHGILSMSHFSHFDLTNCRRSEMRPGNS